MGDTPQTGSVVSGPRQGLSPSSLHPVRLPLWELLVVLEGSKESALNKILTLKTIVVSLILFKEDWGTSDSFSSNHLFFWLQPWLRCYILDWCMSLRLFQFHFTFSWWPLKPFLFLVWNLRKISSFTGFVIEGLTIPLSGKGLINS